MKKLLFVLSILFLLSCQKEDYRNWQFDQLMLVYRTKCGIDSIEVHRGADGITGSQMDDMIHKYTFERWMRKDELMFIPIYSIYELADSTWVESKIIKCGYMVCI